MTNHFERELLQVARAFVAKVTNLACRAASEQLESAFSGQRAHRASHVAARGTRSPGGRPLGRSAPKRTASDLQRLGTIFTAFVAAHPGLRIEQINERLGLTTQDLALPIRKLLAEGKIDAKGKKRATRYFVAEAKRATSPS